MNWDEYIRICSDYFNKSINPPIDPIRLRERINYIIKMYGNTNWKIFERHIHPEFWIIYCNLIGEDYPSYVKQIFKISRKEYCNVERIDDEARQSTFGWVFQSKLHYVYNHIIKSFIICISHDKDTDKIYFLLAKDRTFEYPLNISAKQQHKMELRDIKNGYVPKWGLLGGKKNIYRTESCYKAAAREFTEESLGLVLGYDINQIATDLEMGSYFKKILITTNHRGNTEQHCFFVKEIPYTPSIREKYINIFKRLYDIYINDIPPTDDFKHPAIVKNRKYIINKDYLEKGEIDWFTMDEMIHMKDEMKDECSIIEYIWTYLL